MKIADLVPVIGRAGYFNKDLEAIRRGGVEADGFRYRGAPATPGFDAVIQPGRAISVMLLLEDGGVAFGDCSDVIFTGAAGRDPLFRPEDHLAVLEGPVRELLRGRTCDAFAPLAAEIESFRWRDRPLHTALRYGLSQALLHATAHARRETMAEIVAREWRTEIAAAPIPILGMCPTDQRFQVDKMIMKRIDLLPHGSFANVASDVGADGGKLLEYAAWVARRVAELGDENYRPAIHLDLYGTLGELFAGEVEAIAGFLGRLGAAVAPLDLYVETPIIAATREAQIEAFSKLRTAIARLGRRVRLVADEWCNTLDDIRVFAEAGAADILQVKAPDLGGIGNTIEALLLCRAKGVGAYLGGSANETDHSARVSAHVALACRPDFMMNKPGQGVDEGLLVLGNEMARTLALVAARRGGEGVHARVGP